MLVEKRNMSVCVVASKPDLTIGFNQDGIDSLIGEIFKVLVMNEVTKEVIVHSDKWRGKIALNKDEYKILN